MKKPRLGAITTILPFREVSESNLTCLRPILKNPDEDHFVIDRAKAEEDAKFDGVCVLRTNTRLSALKAMIEYKRL
jgi:hypothetical protein